MLKKYFIVLLALFFVVTAGLNGWAAGLVTEWGKIEDRQKEMALQKVSPMPPRPLMMEDALGDNIATPGNPVVDIITVGGGIDGDDMFILLAFSSDTDMMAVSGWIELDTDQDVTTGAAPLANAFIPGVNQDLGVEFLLNLNVGEEAVYIYDANTLDLIGTGLVQIFGHTMDIHLPLFYLGDDGNMNFGTIWGNYTEPTDAAPDSGHGTIIADPLSLTISPPTGTYVSTQGIDLTLIAESAGYSILNTKAVLDGIDITPKLASCLIPGTLLSGGETLRCSGIKGSMLGAGLHTLAVTIFLYNGDIIYDSVIWEIKENTEP